MLQICIILVYSRGVAQVLSDGMKINRERRVDIKGKIICFGITGR